MRSPRRRPPKASGLRVVVPFTRIHRLCDRALIKFAPTAERIFLGQGEVYDDNRDCRRYSQVLVQLWADPKDTLLVEHDMEIHGKVVPEAQRCKEPWCTWPYSGPGFKSNGDPMLRESLGCTRFSAQLMRDEPDLMAAAAAVSQGLPAGDWRRMDAQIAPLLKQRGYEVHVHQPPVLHHHVYPNEGCACGKEHE